MNIPKGKSLMLHAYLGAKVNMKHWGCNPSGPELGSLETSWPVTIRERRIHVCMLLDFSEVFGAISFVLGWFYRGA